jgi:hypothetical protein
VTKIYNPDVCVVYYDTKKKPEPIKGSAYPLQELRDLHVIFGDDLANVPSNWTPHMNSKNLAKIQCTETPRYHLSETQGSTVHLKVSQAVNKHIIKQNSVEAGFGAFNLTLIRRPCNRSGHTSGFSSWYCQESKDFFLDFDCNFWSKTMSGFEVPIPRFEVTYEDIPKTSPTGTKSEEDDTSLPQTSSDSNKPGDDFPPLSSHKKIIPGTNLHMPAASVLESELEPKKRCKATKILDSTQDAPGPLKAFKLYEDSPDAPGPLKAFKLCEDSTVAPGPTKRLKLVSTDDSGRASV